MLIKKRSGLSKADMEMIVVTTSATSGCIYCVVARGAVLCIGLKDKFLVDKFSTNYLHMKLFGQQRQMLNFAKDD